MSVEIDGRVIRGIDINGDMFRGHWKDLPSQVQTEARVTLKSLFFSNLDQLPAKLHCHQLTDKLVPSYLDPKKKVKAWSLHITADDRYKASFTFENGTAYFRTCGLHDVVDKKP